ncbi:ArsR/SmtB family transcription factor [Flavitalea flava]
MDAFNSFREIASLIGEPSRASMLWQLFDAGTLSAGELAMTANITPQSASGHLKKLVEAGILKVEQKGKCRYYRYAKHEVTTTIEALRNLVALKKTDTDHFSTEYMAMKNARICYDHIAGRLGVGITRSLIKQKLVVEKEKSFIVTNKGLQWLENFDIDIMTIGKGRRPFALKCIDLTEQAPHLSGGLGAALLNSLLEKNWIRKTRHNRILIITGEGRKEMTKAFHIEL